jgi:hypothetical protein
MNWEELLKYLSRMTPEQKMERAVVFDYATDSFYDLAVCLDGEPEFHLTAN